MSKQVNVLIGNQAGRICQAHASVLGRALANLSGASVVEGDLSKMPSPAWKTHLSNCSGEEREPERESVCGDGDVVEKDATTVETDENLPPTCAEGYGNSIHEGEEAANCHFGISMDVDVPGIRASTGEAEGPAEVMVAHESKQWPRLWWGHFVSTSVFLVFQRSGRADFAWVGRCSKGTIDAFSNSLTFYLPLRVSGAYHVRRLFRRGKELRGLQEVRRCRGRTRARIPGIPAPIFEGDYSPSFPSHFVPSFVHPEAPQSVRGNLSLRPLPPLQVPRLGAVVSNQLLVAPKVLLVTGSVPAKCGTFPG